MSKAHEGEASHPKKQIGEGYTHTTYHAEMIVTDEFVISEGWGPEHMKAAGWSRVEGGYSKKGRDL